jgi:hypothetical protein
LPSYCLFSCAADAHLQASASTKSSTKALSSVEEEMQDARGWVDVLHAHIVAGKREEAVSDDFVDEVKKVLGLRGAVVRTIPNLMAYSD